MNESQYRGILMSECGHCTQLFMANNEKSTKLRLQMQTIDYTHLQDLTNMEALSFVYGIPISNLAFNLNSYLMNLLIDENDSSTIGTQDHHEILQSLNFALCSSCAQVFSELYLLHQKFNLISGENSLISKAVSGVESKINKEFPRTADKNEYEGCRSITLKNETVENYISDWSDNNYPFISPQMEPSSSTNFKSLSIETASISKKPSVTRRKIRKKPYCPGGFKDNFTADIKLEFSPPSDIFKEYEITNKENVNSTKNNELGPKYTSSSSLPQNHPEELTVTVDQLYLKSKRKAHEMHQDRSTESHRKLKSRYVCPIKSCKKLYKNMSFLRIHYRTCHKSILNLKNKRKESKGSAVVQLQSISADDCEGPSSSKGEDKSISKLMNCSQLSKCNSKQDTQVAGEDETSYFCFCCDFYCETLLGLQYHSMDAHPPIVRIQKLKNDN